MAFLRNHDVAELRSDFRKLEDDVTLVNFTQEHECQSCQHTRMLLSEVAQLSPKVRLETYNYLTDSAARKTFRIEMIPATVVMAKRDVGIRFYGIPSGYEFSTLVDTIKMVSSGASGLSPDTRRALAKVKHPLKLKVFVTPTCPYCPAAVTLAHQMAVESPLISSEMIESIEFPQLAQKYRVMGVPKTVINEELSLEGAVPEASLLDLVLAASEKMEAQKEEQEDNTQE
jgi:glutaredoxin-like protein